MTTLSNHHSGGRTRRSNQAKVIENIKRCMVADPSEPSGEIQALLVSEEKIKNNNTTPSKVLPPTPPPSPVYRDEFDLVNDTQRNHLRTFTDGLTVVKYNTLLSHIEGFDAFKKRKIYGIIRDHVDQKGRVNNHNFLPELGFTVGQYCIGDTLGRPVKNSSGGK